MFVKICGLTNLEDTVAAFEGGARAAGFNFYRGSARYVDPAVLADWVGSVPKGMWKVGVFVNESPARVMEIAKTLGLDVAQLHGDERPEDVPGGLRVWKAARVREGFKFSSLDGFCTEAVLLDGPASGVPWFSASKTAPSRSRLVSGIDSHTSRDREGAVFNIILAGGLDASNVREAIELIQPWGVDACSRLESAPGKKDHARMRRFIETALSC